MRRLQLLFVLFLAGSFLGGCDRNQPALPNRKVRVLETKALDLSPTLRFPGRSRPAKSVNLAFRVSGQLTELNALVGQEVKKDAILARIDPRDFQFQISNIEGSLMQTLAALRLAKTEFTRFSNISKRDPGAVSVILVKQKEEAVNNLKGQLRSVRANLDIAKRALEDTELKAPFNGTVVAVFADNYEQVSASQFIVRLVSTEEIEVLIDVPDRLISSMKDAKNIQVRFDAIAGMQFPATIEEIGTEASPTTRTFPVTLVVTPPKNIYLFPGMTGTVFLEQSRPHAEHKMTFKLPLSALFSIHGQLSQVFIADPATWKISIKPVNIITLAENYAIVTGLSDRDQVVVSGVNFLNENQLVSPLPVRMDSSGEIFNMQESMVP